VSSYRNNLIVLIVSLLGEAVSAFRSTATGPFFSRIGFLFLERLNEGIKSGERRWQDIREAQARTSRARCIEEKAAA
jgi:hypothetical protein